MGKITAKFTEDQVRRLNEYQTSGVMHPYTCPGNYKVCENQRELIATVDGWVCKCGKYTQNWAHDFTVI